ncbi:class I adenylate-forming enzyme family protein [Verrucomicrobiota bacterium]
MHSNALEIIADRFEDSKDRTFFTAVDDHDYTYGDLLYNAQKLAEEWKNKGLKPGDKIAFILSNSFAVICCYFSCAIGGFVACPIVDTLHKNTIGYILDSMKPALVLHDPPAIHKDCKETGSFVLKAGLDSPFLVMFTAGSTGKPKAICHSFRSVVGCAHAFACLTGMSDKTLIYHVLPMTYMAGFLNSMLSPFTAGASIVEGPLFSPAMAVEFWPRPLGRSVNTLSIIPTIASALCRLTRDSETIEAVKSQITQVQCTSAPIQKALRQRFKNMFSIPLQDCYGITELGGPLSCQNKDDAEADIDFSVPLPEIEVAIRKESELWIKSPFSMMGYLEDGKFVSPFDKDGFMNTGDMASQVNGKIEITGRKKDVIIRGGINVSPTRVESVLSLMSGIEEVAVIGCPHDFWGEDITACVISDNDTADFKSKVVQYCKASLGQHERPDRIVFIKEFPRSFIGKVKKNALKETLEK